MFKVFSKTHPKTPLPHKRVEREGASPHMKWIVMLRIGYRMPLGLTMRPADRILRELPPSLSAYRLRFPSAPPRLRCLLTCGVRVAAIKKPCKGGFRLGLPHVEGTRLPFHSFDEAAFAGRSIAYLELLPGTTRSR